MVADPGLTFTAKADAQGQIGPDPPIVERKKPRLELVQTGQRVARSENWLAPPPGFQAVVAGKTLGLHRERRRCPSPARKDKNRIADALPIDAYRSLRDR
jgi:hypothetical protein